MELSPELYQRLVGNAVPTVSPKPADPAAAVLPAGARRPFDRRAAARQSFGKRAKINPTKGPGAGFWQTVLLQDISTSGIGMLVDEKMALGETFLLQIQDSNDEAMQLLCSVKRCEPGGFGGVSITLGADFMQVVMVANEVIAAPAVESFIPAAPVPEAEPLMARLKAKAGGAFKFW